MISPETQRVAAGLLALMQERDSTGAARLLADYGMEPGLVTDLMMELALHAVVFARQLAEARGFEPVEFLRLMALQTATSAR